MKILNDKEILEFADTLVFTQEQAKEITDLFVELSYSWQVNSPLDSVEDYIDEWGEHWHRETNAEEFYTYEKEHCFFDYDNQRVFDSIETFMDFACVEQQFAFQLKCCDMVIVMC